MAISNGTCVSFCNQPKALFGYTLGESRRYVVAFTRLRHILGMFPLEFREKFGSQKTRIMGLSGSEDSLTIG